jgi:hypothetical protein
MAGTRPDIEELISSLEGRLIGHRKLLAQLVAASPRSTREALASWFAERETLMDGQEDPGAVPQAALALELALSDEIHQIAELSKVFRQRAAGASGSDASKDPA